MRGHRPHLWLGTAAMAMGMWLACVHARPSPPPDVRCPAGQGIYTQGLDAGATCSNLEVVRLAGLSVCPSDRRAKLEAIWPSISVYLMPGPFVCFGHPRCTGTQQGTGLRIASPAALVDEAGHLIWQTCFDRSGEAYPYPDAGEEYDGDFARWCAPLRGEMR